MTTASILLCTSIPAIRYVTCASCRERSACQKLNYSGSQATAGSPQLQRPLIRSTTHAPDQPTCRPQLLHWTFGLAAPGHGQCGKERIDFHDLSRAPTDAQVERVQGEFTSACSRSSSCQGRKSLSVMLDCPFGKVRVRRDTQGFGAGGSNDGQHPLVYINSRNSISHTRLLGRSRARAHIYVSQGLRLLRIHREYDDAHLFTQPRTRRINQLVGLDFSHWQLDLAAPHHGQSRKGAADFHAFSRAVFQRVRREVARCELHGTRCFSSLNQLGKLAFN